MEAAGLCSGSGGEGVPRERLIEGKAGVGAGVPLVHSLGAAHHLGPDPGFSWLWRILPLGKQCRLLGKQC